MKSRKVLSGLLARKTPVTVIIYMSDKNKKLKAERIRAIVELLHGHIAVRNHWELIYCKNTISNKIAL